MFVVACNLVEDANVNRKDSNRVICLILNNEVTAGLFSAIAADPVAYLFLSMCQLLIVYLYLLGLRLSVNVS
jgi:hypothetical protein